MACLNQIGIVYLATVCEDNRIPADVIPGNINNIGFEFNPEIVSVAIIHIRE